jgi:dTDP-glucose 4,6-dehydratase
VSHHVVTGGAGFLGSHLCEALVERGDSVVCVDDFSSGSEENIEALARSGRFKVVHGDVCDILDKVDGPVDTIAHLASPASPADYLARPLETLAVGSRGTEAALRLAHAHGARFVLASTSEVYGNPLVHPQREDYWGNVNPIGPRSVYDEAKRFSEAMATAFHRTLGLDVGIVRIFNTYGPRLRAGDGRVVSNFIVQALRNQSLTIYGDGHQTRSLCYVDDLVRGLVTMLDSNVLGPINLGNPTEMRVADLAELVLRITGSSCPFIYEPLPEDDPVRRRPDITKAQELLGWVPLVSQEEGLLRTIRWFRSRDLSKGKSKR